MQRRSLRWAAAMAALAAAATAAVGSAQTSMDPNLKVTRIFNNQQVRLTTSMVWLGPDDMIMTELDGDIRRWTGGALSTVQTIPVVWGAGQGNRGLMSITLHPDFAANQYAYMFYSHTVDDLGVTWDENRLSRFTWNGSQFVDETPILAFPFDPAQPNGSQHLGGPILFGPDGKLYGTTGDFNGRNRAEQNNLAQAGTSSKTGGIYRINDDGTIPTDNPFTAHPNGDFHLWYSYGARNMFGIDFDPVTGKLWNTDNGNNEYDEVNLVEPGMNSGWTKVMGPIGRTSFTTDDLVNLGPASTYSDPEFSFFDNIGITAIRFLHGSGLGPAYDDDVIIGGVASSATGHTVFMLPLNAARDGFELGGPLADLVADNTSEAALVQLSSPLGKVTDVKVGPDGLVYVATTDFGMYRISHIPDPIGGVAAVSLENSQVLKFASPGFGATTADSGDGLLAPLGAVYDAAGNLYVADVLRSRINKITPAGVVSIFADASDGLATPAGLAFDPISGDLFVADYLTSRIGRFDAAGNGSLFADGSDGIAGAFDVAFDAAGNLYVASLENSRVLKFDGLGNVSIFADASDGLFSPIGLAVDAVGNVFVSDVLTSKIYKFDGAGLGAVFADSGDGLATPIGMDFDSAGNLYVADYLTTRIGRFTPGGVGSLYADGSDGLVGVFDVALPGSGGFAPLLFLTPEPSAGALALAAALGLIGWRLARRRR